MPDKAMFSFENGAGERLPRLIKRGAATREEKLLWKIPLTKGGKKAKRRRS